MPQYPIHVGKLIREVLEMRGVTQGDLANAINKTRLFVNRQLEKPSIQTEYLILISVALRYDFFSRISHDLIEYASPSVSEPIERYGKSWHTIQINLEANDDTQLKRLEQLLGDKEDTKDTDDKN